MEYRGRIMNAWKPLVLGAAALALAGCATTDPQVDPWFSRDKAYHFAAGAIAGAGVALAARHSDVGDGAAATLGVGAAATIGAGKEWYDRDIRKTYWSWKDFAWDLFGGLVGSFIAASAAD